MKKQTLYMLFPFVQHSLLDVLTFRPDRALRQAAPLPRKLALPLIMQLVDALEYCHSKGVLHRNVKPKHILIQMQEPHDEDNEEFNLQGAHLYLSDFALMRSVSKPKKQVTAEVSLSSSAVFYHGVLFLLVVLNLPVSILCSFR